MKTQPRPIKISFAHLAAKLSWGCPASIFLLSIVSRQAGVPPIILDLVALVLMLAGFSFGIIALFGISRHGRKGVLAPAIVGFVLNGLLLSIFVTNFMAARARAMHHHSSIQASQIIVMRRTSVVEG
jgi:hypothetical protein